MKQTITLRKATAEDAAFLAMVVSEALDSDVMECYEAAHGTIPENRRPLMEVLESIIMHPDTLYTWRHATIAQNAQGAPIGALLAYPGDDYMQRRDLTFSMFSSVMPLSFDVAAMDAETVAGEYYLDSLAVMPSYRGRGVARMLLQAGIATARELHRPAILACSPENLNAKRLYESLGFRAANLYSLFGHPYWRMICQ
ncbi:MAG: GNAT family N-acetyltransferase [Sodaliphilus sp.]